MDRTDGLIATDHIQVELTVRLGRTMLTVGQLSALGADDVLALDHEVADGVDLCVGDRVIARGQLITEGPDDRLCVRITGAADSA